MISQLIRTFGNIAAVERWQKKKKEKRRRKCFCHTCGSGCSSSFCFILIQRSRVTSLPSLPLSLPFFPPSLGKIILLCSPNQPEQLAQAHLLLKRVHNTQHPREGKKKINKDRVRGKCTKRQDFFQPPQSCFPTTNSGVPKWKLGRNAYTLHTRFWHV